MNVKMKHPMSNSKVSMGNIKVKQQKAKKDFWMTKDFSATEIFTSIHVNNSALVRLTTGFDLIFKANIICI